MARIRTLKTAFALAAVGIVGFLAFGSALTSVAGADESATIDDAQIAYAEGSTIEVITYGEDMTLLQSYPVSFGTITNADPAHLAIWDQVRTTVPASYLGLIRQFSVIDEGPAGTVAMVHRSGSDQDQWILSIDAVDAYDTELLRETLLHELAHMVTLDQHHFSFAVHRDPDAACVGVGMELGCAATGSLLADWTSTFWADPSQAAAFDPATFVATYAATSAHEDLAETFLYWAQGDTEAPAGSVLEAKFAWFDAQPELVELRSDLIAASI